MWKTAKQTFVAILEDNGYKQSPFNIPLELAPESLTHKGFTLTPISPSIVPTTSNGRISNLYGNLSVSYTVNTVDELDTYYSEFLELLNKLPQFAVGENYPTVDMLEDFAYAIISIELFLGSMATACD